MRIVIASHGFLPNVGGVSTYINGLAEGFVAAGHGVTVITNANGPSDGYSFKVVRHPSFIEMIKLYTRAEIVIFSNLSIRLIYPIAIIPRKFGLQHHSESAFNLSSLSIKNVLSRHIFDRAIHFMASEYLGRKSGLNDYTVTYPSVNRYLTPNIIREAASRNGAIFVGRLEPGKGILYLLERWPLIKTKLGVDVLRVAGDGSISDKLVRLTAMGSLEGVEYLGPLSREEVASEMGRAAYSLVPSLWDEPFGMVALESLAAACVVIHSNRGGLPEATAGSGFMFDPDDEASLPRALESAREQRDKILASSDEEFRYLAECAMHAKKFSSTETVKKIIKKMRREDRTLESQNAS